MSDRLDLSGLPTGPPEGEWWERRVSELDVSFPERTIELVIMPYEQQTIVEHPQRPGVAVTEICSRGAYDGVERRANRVKVNRDHDERRIIGRALSLHPSRQEGLVGRLHIAKTELGDETLELAADECLDASAGFRPMPGGIRWETRSRCRLLKCFLGHIAMVGEGAYPGAKVLAVRSRAEPPERVATPNLDVVRGWRLTERYDSLSR